MNLDVYSLTASNPLGPLNSTSKELRTAFDIMVKIQTEFQLVGQDLTGNIRVHYEWLITVSIIVYFVS